MKNIDITQFILGGLFAACSICTLVTECSDMYFKAIIFAGVGYIIIKV